MPRWRLLYVHLHFTLRGVGSVALEHVCWGGVVPSLARVPRVFHLTQLATYLVPSSSVCGLVCDLVLFDMRSGRLCDSSGFSVPVSAIMLRFVKSQLRFREIAPSIAGPPFWKYNRGGKLHESKS